MANNLQLLPSPLSLALVAGAALAAFSCIIADLEGDCRNC
jgi:hypothetical protein